MTPVLTGQTRGAVVMHLNVTERKVAEEERERIFDLSLDLICVASFDGRLERVNPAWTDSLGWSAEELTSGPWIEFVHPEDRAATLETLKTVMQGRPVRDFENRYRCKGGAYRWLSWNSQGALETGQVFAVARDVTDRKKSERALAQSNRALKLLSRCNEALIRSNTEEQLLEAVCRIAVEIGGYRLAWVGYPRNDETKKIVSCASAGSVEYLAGLELSWSNDLETSHGPAGTVISTGQSVVIEDLGNDEMFRPWADRAAHHGLRSLVALPLRESGRPFGVLCLYLPEVSRPEEQELKVLQELADDLAFGIASLRHRRERQAAQEKLREQAALLDDATDAIFVRDLNDQIRYWNQGAERLYGWTAAEALGKKVGDLLRATENQTVPPEATAQLFAQGRWTGEVEKLTKQGKRITVQARWTLLRDDAGAPKAVLSINSDITEKKKLEAQFLRAQRMENIGTLAAGIAHDLNNVLAPIMMSLDLLKPKVSEPDLQLLLETVSSSATRAADLVRQLLSFGRGVAGQRLAVDPRRLVREVEKIVADTFPKSIQLVFARPQEIWPVLGDPTQLHQVLLNLCVNARDAMPEGGKLSVTLANREVDAIYASSNPEAAPGRYVAITVADTGTGIAPDIQEKIFEPFFTTKEPGKGTGLGLSTALGIVKSHGGFIELSSQPRRGSRFFVHLPAAEKQSGPELEDDAELASLQGHGECILLVDDEANILEVCRAVLERHGYRVLLASNGAEAVSRYAQEKDAIAAVVTDVAMPVMDGPALVVALRMINPAVRVIATSGLTNSHHLLNATASVNHFVPKPFTAQTLLQTLRTVLEEGRPAPGSIS